MSLGNNTELIENKMILLYIVEKIKTPMNNIQFTKLITENNFMNYFIFQQALFELCESNYLIYDKSEEKNVYKILKSGQEALKYFADRIPAGTKNRINNLAVSFRKQLKNEMSIIADYTPESENVCHVSCKIQEDDFVLLEVRLTVGSKNDARNICNNWKQNSQSIYPDIINSLLKPR